MAGEPDGGRFGSVAAVHVLGYDIHRRPPEPPFGELARLFEALRVDHVIDVGANDGQYASAIRDLVRFPGRIDCVEPQPHCAARLRARGDVTVHQTALGSEPGQAEFTLYSDSKLASLHRFNETGVRVWDDPATADVVEVVSVPVTTLDSLLDEIDLGERLWLKIDTQGHDLAVIDGLDRHLGRVVGIQSEIAFTPLYAGAPEAWTHLEALASKGFRLAGLYPLTRVDALALAEADGLFVRAG